MSAEQHVESQATARALRRLREELRRELAVLRTPDAGDQLRDVFAMSPPDIADAVSRMSDNE